MIEMVSLYRPAVFDNDFLTNFFHSFTSQFINVFC